MTKCLVLSLILNYGCARSMTVGVRAAGVASLACDYFQTLARIEQYQSAGSWQDAHRTDQYETNIILGGRPSATELTVYMLGVGAVLSALEYYLPDVASNLMWTGVATAETTTVYHNANNGDKSNCGFGR